MSTCRHSQAGHCAIWHRDKTTKQPIVLMMLRFDGKFGFPGGYFEESETGVVALSREIQEELGMKVDVSRLQFVSKEEDVEGPKGALICHFYTYEVSEEELAEIEANAHKAMHHPEEVLGIVRVPIIGGWYDAKTSRGNCLRNFTKNHFVANSKFQLLKVLEKLGADSDIIAQCVGQ